MVSLEKTPSNDFVEIDISKLKPDQVNKTFYGEEEPDIDLVNSIQEKGLLELIIIDDNNVIVSGHRRWIALKYLATIDTKWEKTRCRVMRFESERERALKIIEFNPHKGKSISRFYNEMKLLHSIYDPEALAASLANLRQYSDVPKKDRRRIIQEAIKRGMLDPQSIDHSLSEEEQWNQARLFVSELLKETDEKKVFKALGRTRNIIAKQLGLGKTNCDKISEIGAMAEEGDDIAILAMKNMDLKKWKIGSAHNVIRIRKLQKSGRRGHVDARKFIDEIMREEKKASEASKFLESLTDRIKVTDGEKYDILLVRPDVNPDEFKIRPLPLHKKSILFWLTPAGYLKSAIALLDRWGFSYQSCIPVFVGTDHNNPWFHQRHDLLLIYSINNYVPTDMVKFTEVIKSTDIYDAIDKAFPKKTKYDVLRNMKFGFSTEDREKDSTPPSPAMTGDW